MLSTKRWMWALVDAACWVLSVYLATWLRLDFDIGPALSRGTAVFAVGVTSLHVLVGWLIGPSGVTHQRGSIDEVAAVAGTVLSTAALGFTVMLLVANPHLPPRTVPIISGVLALTVMFAARFVVRTYRTRRACTGAQQRRVVIFGAGEGGRQLLRTMVTTPEAGLAPVAILDDDPRKARLHVDGVRVRGTRQALGAVAAETRADTLVIAVPSADAALIRDLRGRAVAVGLDVLVLPPISEILGGRPTTTDLRDVDLSDLLGRRSVRLDTYAIAQQIRGQVILVTGAGGSIGSELCRQIARFDPLRLYLLDRDESGLQGTQLSLTGSGLLDTDEIILADIRDPESMAEIFQRTRPAMVFHAAALKHLPLLEAFPLEAWKTNVLGTLNVLTAASDAGVGTFVNISTDKAADPICVLGHSKRVAERLTTGFAHREPGRYVSVRFGNVLGSRGSVVHAFSAQIQRGGPVTVTHPDVQRYFMLIPEACQLVLEAASIGQDGEALLLEMGEQVKIVEVAQTLIRMSGRSDIEITYTGLRRGEKLAETLNDPAETRHPTVHPMVSRVGIPPITSEEVTMAGITASREAASWMLGHATIPADPYAALR